MVDSTGPFGGRVKPRRLSPASGLRRALDEFVRHHARLGLFSSATSPGSLVDVAVFRFGATAVVRRTNAMDSQHAMLTRARQNGTRKYTTRNTNRPATSSS